MCLLSDGTTCSKKGINITMTLSKLKLLLKYSSDQMRKFKAIQILQFDFKSKSLTMTTIPEKVFQTPSVLVVQVAGLKVCCKLKGRLQKTSTSKGLVSCSAIYSLFVVSSECVFKLYCKFGPISSIIIVELNFKIIFNLANIG